MMQKESSEVDWGSLTKSNNKIELFKKDQYFHLSHQVGANILKDKLYEVLQNHALILIKPESIYLEKVELVLKLVEDYGYEPVFFSFKRITDIKCLELWKYQWPGASFLRMLVSQKLMSISDSLVVILKAPKSLNEWASTAFSKLKGSAIESERKAYHIRTVLKPINRMLNYIHASDEPSDVMRELGVLFSWDELINIYTTLQSGKKCSFHEIAAGNKAGAATLAKEINPYNEIQTFKTSLITLNGIYKGGENLEIYKKVIKKLDDVIKGEDYLDFSFFENLSNLGILTWSWQLVIIATTFIEHESGNRKLL